MKLSLGLRGNLHSTRHIIEMTKGRIDEVFLSVLNAQYGSGRAFVHEVDFDELELLVPFAASHGVEVTVVRNGPCNGGRECLPAFRAEFREYLRRLRGAGVRKVTLTHPLLMQQAREAFPDLEIVVSVYAEANTLDRVKYFESLGVGRVTLPHELNRNLRLLERIASNTSVELALVVNLACVHHCTRDGQHCRYAGHSTNELRVRGASDCYLPWCDSFRLNRPWELLATDWIRPEDLWRYEAVGIHCFKLAGRATSTSWLVRAARAYAERRYDGNLLDLLAQCDPYTDRVGGRVPFRVPNRALDRWMERLYACGHACHGCRFCEELYERLQDEGVQSEGLGADPRPTPDRSTCVPPPG